MTDSFTLPPLPSGYRWNVTIDGRELCVDLEKEIYNAYGDPRWVAVMSDQCSATSLQAVTKRMADFLFSSRNYVGIYDNTGKKIS